MSEADLKLSSEQERELLERYAPVLRFSAGERFFPTSVDDYVHSCDKLFVFDPQEKEWLERPTEQVLTGMDDPNSFLRFLKRDSGQGLKKESTLKRSLITLSTLLLCTLLGCVALWWLFDISDSVWRSITAVLVLAVSLFLSKNDGVQRPIRMVFSLPRTILRVMGIVLQDRKSLFFAIGVYLIFSLSNFILIRLVDYVDAGEASASRNESAGMALIAALPLGVFFYALITESAGAVVELKSGRSVKWANEAYDKYRKEIVGYDLKPESGESAAPPQDSQTPDSEHVCTYYGRIVPLEDKKWTVLQYFYFYAFNDWRRYGGMNLHEGDWESVSVYVPRNPSPVSTSLLDQLWRVFRRTILKTTLDQMRPFGVAYSQHHGKEFLLWENIERYEHPNSGEFHPVVYVALGSHANYPFADSRIDPSEMERFGLLQNTVSKIELRVRRIGLFGGRLPADTADGLGLHLDPAAGEPEALRCYYERLDRLDDHSFDSTVRSRIQKLLARIQNLIIPSHREKERRQRISKLWWTEEEKRCARAKLELISDKHPAWVNYAGLWGDRTDVADESGPSGPRWAKVADGKQEERTSWDDPLGWLEERKADAFESTASRDLADIVTHMWELKAAPSFEPLEASVRWVSQPGHQHDSPKDFDAFLDHQDESLLIFGESRDVNRTIVHRLAQLQMWRVRNGRDRRIPVILPLSLRALSRTRTADADSTASETSQSGTAGADNTASETSNEVAGFERVVELTEWIAAELSALYGLPASVFEQWLDKKEFGETAGDETGVLLFIELDAQGLSDERGDEPEGEPQNGRVQWKQAFRSFVTRNRVIVSLDGKDDGTLGLSHAVEAQASKKARVAAALVKLDDLPTAERERLRKWLEWLARQMKAHDQRLYQVDRMQPKWLEWPSRLVYYALELLIPLLVVGGLTWKFMEVFPLYFGSPDSDGYPTFRILFGAAAAIAFWLISHRRFGIGWAAISGIAFALAVIIGGSRLEADVVQLSIFGVVFGLGVFAAFFVFGRVYGSGRSRYSIQLDWDTIEIYQVRQFAWRRALLGAATGVVLGFVIWFLMGGYLARAAIFTDGAAHPFGDTAWRRAVAFAIGTVFGAGFFLLWGFGKAHREPNRDKIVAPYQRIASARKNAIITGLLGAFFMGAPYILGAAVWLRDVGRPPRVLTDFTDFKVFAAWFGSWAGVFIGLVCGGLTVFQHYVLRLVLWFSRRDPYKLLKQARDCDLLVMRGREEKEDGKLVKRGDAYEFITSSLMDHFAGLPNGD